jgi:hypothetical protein
MQAALDMVRSGHEERALRIAGLDLRLHRHGVREPPHLHRTRASADDSGGGRLCGSAAGGPLHWMEKAKTSGFPFLAQFARALGRDKEAVQLAITTPWSNGILEGHINRLKAIKRQMYGRAGFELLLAKVLPWEASKGN